jgi:hypothetical protein
MRPADQGYLPFIYLLFSILAAGKCDSLSVLNHRLKVTWAPVSAYSAFSWPKNTIPGTSWNPRLRVHGFCERLFSNYVAWRYDYSRAMRLYTHNYLASTEPLYVILATWKWDYSRVMRILAEEYITSVD